MDFTEKTVGSSSELGLGEYVEALEVERQKIQVFQRELPLCLELVTQTIERCKERLSSGAATTTEYLHRHQSEECNSEQTSSEGHHVFEEFIPLKRSGCSSAAELEEEEEEHESPADKSTVVVDSATKSKKHDWLRSVQLWNDPTATDPLQQESEKKEVRKNGGAFTAFQREKSGGSPESGPASDPAVSSSGEEAEGNKGEASNNKDNGQRKQRRNWSPELHKRFLNALQQLGGSHAATPKQIRELMKVDGLTNDEVKSHLQKYRLHTRRPAQNMTNNGGSPAQQVVFVGGIWVQPSTGDPSGSGGIYAPVVHRPQQAEERAIRTSSSTTSHAF